MSWPSSRPGDPAAYMHAQQRNPEPAPDNISAAPPPQQQYWTDPQYNTNQYFQPHANSTQPQANNIQQYPNPQVYPNTQPQQNLQTHLNNTQTHAQDNWEWGWEDRQQQNDNLNANISDSFADEQAWNWSATPANAQPTIPRNPRLEDITPQWSVESQMSSADPPSIDDDVHQTSNALSDLQLSNRENVAENHEYQYYSQPDIANGRDEPAGIAQQPYHERQSVPSNSYIDDVPSYTPSALSVEVPTVNRSSPDVARRTSNDYETANLEMPPDNSERPHGDEVERDRDEYLQTAHLSSADYEYAPREAGAGRADDPPPGLARLVPGRDRPVGMDRVVTGLDRQVDGDGSESSPPAPDRPPDPPADNGQHKEPGSTRVKSAHRVHTSEDDTDRDRAFKSSPRRERRRGSRDKEREATRYRDDERSGGRREEGRREEGRRDDGRDGRREEGRRDERREDRRRDRRRYDTEDTDYNSERERDRRSYREGSYSRRPPRPDERRYRDSRYPDDREHYSSLRRRKERPREEESRGGEWASGGEGRGRREEPRRQRRDRHRDYYADYYEGYDSQNASYQQQQQLYRYYQHLRLTDPAAYAVIYKQLVSAQKYPQQPGYTADQVEHASVHSGRSSANPPLNMSAYEGWYGRGAPPRATSRLRSPAISDISDVRDGSLSMALEESTLRSDRLTPHKFCGSHIKASVSVHGLVLCRGGYGAPGRPRVSVLSLSSCLTDDPQVKQLLAYPGPLVKGVTHKKRAVEYCMERAGESGVRRDRIGYELIWRLLALLLTHNGALEPVDVAELLLQSQREHPYTSNQEENEAPVPPPSSPDDSLAAYRDLLLVGNHTDALETACAAGLWGHALVLGEALGGRARAAVAARFLAALSPRDPLHTLYSATMRRPPAQCAGDWRPHLAMLLTTPDSSADLQAKHILALGDSLRARDLPYSAQLCYLMSREPFGRHPLSPWRAPSAPAPPPRLTLLLTTPADDSLQRVARVTHVAATEIYEYARSLQQPDFVIPELQVYKWWLGCRLAECGQGARALRYAEQVAGAVLAAPAEYPQPFVQHVADTAHRLRHLESDVTAGAGEEPGWLTQLTLLHQQNVASRRDLPSQEAVQTGWQPVEPAPAPAWSLEPPVWQPEPVPAWQPPPPAWQPPPPDTQPAWQPPPPDPLPPAEPLAWSSPLSHQQVQEVGEEAVTAGESGADTGYGWSSPYSQDGTEQPRPRITMPGEHNKERRASEDSNRRSPALQSDGGGGGGGGGAGGGGEAGKGAGAGGGWLGNIFTKISLKPKNQMILPDDKNPTIVWDPEKRRWRNTEQDDGDASNEPPPPPRTQPTGGVENSGAGAPPSSLYNLQKGRLMKKCYVNVLKPTGSAPAAAAAAPAAPPPPPLASTPPAYFVPSPQ